MNDDWYFDVVNVFVGIYYILCYMIVMNDIIKDVDEDSFYVIIMQDDVESVFYMFGISSIIYIEEVGGFIII